MAYRPTDRFQNWFITSLQTGINDTTGSFRLNDNLNVQKGRLVIDPYDESVREVVKVTSVDGNLVYVERGDDNTQPHYHLEGAVVALNVVAADMNDLYADFAGIVDDVAGAVANNILPIEVDAINGTVDMSGGYAVYNPVTQEQKVIDMTDAAAMRALKPGSYGVYTVNGATNVPGGVGVGGILEVKSAMITGIANPFYSFTFTRVSSTPSNTAVWNAGCSTAATPLIWYSGGIGPTNKLPAQNVDFTTLIDTYSSMSGTASALSATPQTLATYTVPITAAAQRIYVTASFEFNASANAAEMYGDIVKNGVRLAMNYWYAPSVVYFNTITVLATTTVVPGDVISFRVARTTGTGNGVSGRSSYIIRGVPI